MAYNRDLDFVLGIMRAVAVDEVGETMAERVRAYRSMLDKTPVDQLDVKEEPTVFVRVNTDGWLDAVVRYLVDPTGLSALGISASKASPATTRHPQTAKRIVAVEAADRLTDHQLLANGRHYFAAEDRMTTQTT